MHYIINDNYVIHKQHRVIEIFDQVQRKECVICHRPGNIIFFFVTILHLMNYKNFKHLRDTQDVCCVCVYIYIYVFFIELGKEKNTTDKN